MGQVDNYSGTSANVVHHNILMENHQTGESDFIHLLDFEGDSAADELPVGVDKDKIEKTIRKALGVPNNEVLGDHFGEYTKLRAAGVREHFPRLAYAVSDVLVLIDTVDFSRTDYFDKIREFTCRATEGLNKDELPHLIIVRNQVPARSMAGSSDPDQIAKDVLSKHDKSNTLQKYFKSIKFVKIPEIEGKLFDNAWGVFCDTFNKVLEASYTSKLPRGSLYSSRVWSFLLRTALERFHSTTEIRMSEILTYSMLNQLNDKMIMQAMNFYYQVNIAPMPNHWIKARHATAQVLTTFFLEDLNKMETMIPGSTITRYNELQNVFLAKLEQLVNAIERDKPCSAKNGQGKLCKYLKGTHRKDHYCKDEGQSNSMWRSVQKVLHVKGYWKGKFSNEFYEHSNYPDSFELIKRSMLQCIESIQKVDPHFSPLSLFLVRREVLTDVLRDMVSNFKLTEDKKFIPSKSCIFCAEPAYVPLRCNHHFCSECASLSNQTQYLTPLLDTRDGPITNACPLCSAGLCFSNST